MISPEFHDSKLHIQPATMADFEDVKLLMDRANQHSVDKSGGTLQWTKIEYVHGQLEHHIQVGELFVARGRQDRIIGCVALTEHDGMWPDRADTQALYFHKLMKDPSVGEESAGMATTLLHFAAEEAVRRGKDVVRCDVKTELHDLLGYYEQSFGFEEKGAAVYESTQVPATLLEVGANELLQRTDGLTSSDPATMSI